MKSHVLGVFPSSSTVDEQIASPPRLDIVRNAKQGGKNAMRNMTNQSDRASLATVKACGSPGSRNHKLPQSQSQFRLSITYFISRSMSVQASHTSFSSIVLLVMLSAHYSISTNRFMIPGVAIANLTKMLSLMICELPKPDNPKRFRALALTSFYIDQLRHLNRGPVPSRN